MAEAAEGLYQRLTDAGVEVLYDDRDESPGVKLTDAELLGMPTIVTISPRSLAGGGAEVTDRATGERAASTAGRRGGRSRASSIADGWPPQTELCPGASRRLHDRSPPCEFAGEPPQPAEESARRPAIANGTRTTGRTGSSIPGRGGRHDQPDGPDQAR